MVRTKCKRIYMTAWYSILHMLVDGVCALAMFGRFLQGGNGYFYILLYNFCAFALQMPMGVILDALNWSNKSKRDYAFAAAVAGVFCTVLGAVIHPAVLGIGNALFHVGGGVGVIEADRTEEPLVCHSLASDAAANCSTAKKLSTGGWRGRGLGIFVAPGALGLYLGTLVAKNGAWKAGFFSVSAVMVLLCAVAWHRIKRYAKTTLANVRADIKKLKSDPCESKRTGSAWYENEKPRDIWDKGKKAGNADSESKNLGHAKWVWMMYNRTK